MFTGLIETVGKVASLTQSPSGMTLRLKSALPAAELELGESIAVNGCCLTVTKLTPGTFDADASLETLRKTNLGELRVGSEVNLERAMRLGDRLGGHLVLGHVDGTGKIASMTPEGNATIVRVHAPSKLMPFMIDKGSITIDGISLTINRLMANGFEVAIIPHTSQNVALLHREVGWRVNLEVDVLGKYVARLLGSRTNATDGISLEFLQQNGFIDANRSD